MKLRFFTIPIRADEEAVAELNGFLAGHRILAVDRSFVQDGANSSWALCVSYEPVGDSRPPAAKRGKVDYRDVLSEGDFSAYARLRSLRKEIADSEGVPVYALFTNEQMAEMVTRRAGSAGDLREIPGVGAARVTKYGEAFLAALAEALTAETPTPGASDEA